MTGDTFRAFGATEQELKSELVGCIRFWREHSEGRDELLASGVPRGSVRANGLISAMSATERRMRELAEALLPIDERPMREVRLLLENEK